MRPQTLIPAVLTTLTALVLLSASDAEAQIDLNDGPLIRFEAREFNFGDMEQAAHQSHIFEFRNGGTETLLIEKVEASCGCTAAAPADSILAPGESSGIEVTFHSRDFKGEQTKVVAVYTNDPAEPRVDLAISANVIPFVRFEHDQLTFGEVPLGTRPTLATLVTADLDTDFEILSVSGGEDVVEWKVVPASAPDQIAYRLEGTLRGDAPIGPFDQRIVLELNHPNKSKERVGIKGHVFSYFLLDEQRVNFHTVKQPRSVTRNMDIRCGEDRKYQITEVEVPSDAFDLQLSETSAGYRLDATFHSNKLAVEGRRQRFREFAVLHTTDPNQPEIVVELSGVARN